MLTAKIDCIVLANPTDSDVRHTQMVCPLLDVNLRFRSAGRPDSLPRPAKSIVKSSTSSETVIDSLWVWDPV